MRKQLEDNPPPIVRQTIKVRSPLTAVRAKCLDCSCGSSQEVRECPITTCPLYAYRFGKRPSTVAGTKPKRQMTESQRAGLEKARKLREAQKGASA